jgi:tRNA pseudouridine38-40 synthase
MAHNLCLQIAYDGTNYLGWQKTAMGPSIEEILQACLEQILQEPLSLQAASRTDAGVHAQGQVVNCFTRKEKLDYGKLRHSLNALLPPDIVVRKAYSVPIAFHPTLDCVGKEYHYSLCFDTVQLPHERLYSWHYPYPLDLPTMRKALFFLLGTRDFSALCNAQKNGSSATPIRTVQAIEILEQAEKQLLFTIQGTSFLYKMVRNLVGTLVYIGRGKLALEALPRILEGRERAQAGITAPAHGLCLHRVVY